MKKILSLLLSVCLVLTMIPAISFAAEDGQASGDGDVIPIGITGRDCWGRKSREIRAILKSLREVLPEPEAACRR